MDFSELLPIGSVVMLKNGQKRLMVFGVGQTDFNDQKDYDYIGVMYPEGNVGDGSQFLFNQGDIDTVYFRGYEDEERTEFLRKLKNFYEQGQSE